MLRTVAVAALLAIPAGAAECLSLRILVYNYARAPEETIVSMQDRVGGLFATAGVSFQWFDCLHSTHPACTEEEASPRLLILRVLPGVDAIDPAVLGTAQGALYASVYYERVRALATGHRRVSELLACAVAHEFGHLLLGKHAHSRAGIMRNPWRDTELDHGLPGVFRFSAAERDRIRLNVLGRTALR